jgi:hypothetical protein
MEICIELSHCKPNSTCGNMYAIADDASYLCRYVTADEAGLFMCWILHVYNKVNGNWKTFF